MEVPTKAVIILHVETSKGFVLHKEFTSHAELFDYVCDYILGDCAFDHLSRLIEHTTEEWRDRGKHYKGPPGYDEWQDIDEFKAATSGASAEELRRLRRIEEAARNFVEEGVRIDGDSHGLYEQLKAALGTE